ncbi:hypothetical protein NST07_08850 [Paenibacillus sp. FSL L8-0340]
MSDLQYFGCQAPSWGNLTLVLEDKPKCCVAHVFFGFLFVKFTIKEVA